MALIPLIQPPIMKLLTTKKEREIKMDQLRTVSKTEKIIFPIVVTVLCVLVLPSVAPLIGMFMLGNLFKECGVTERLSDTAQNSLCNIVTIMLGTTVGATAEGKTFLATKTILVIVYLRKKVREKIRQTSFLCTLWARMYQVLSVLLLQPDIYFLLLVNNY